MRSLRALAFGLSPAESDFARRGFRCGSDAVRQGLERAGRAFITGYNAAVAESDLRLLATRLNAVEVNLRGFAFEGAAMGLTLLDRLTPWNRTRWRAFVEGAGTRHIYMMHVGAGWALARLSRMHRDLERRLSAFDPLLRWLVVDGYGFHSGYFHWRRYLDASAPPPPLTGYPGRVFDQGLGRSLWFVDGADPARIASTIGRFPQSRHEDFWSGVGLACAYAGGVGAAAVTDLRDAAGRCQPQLAQGASFAAAARARAGNVTPDTEIACRVLCGVSASEAARLVQQALDSLGSDDDKGARYERWRQRLHARFAPVEAVLAGSTAGG